MMACGHAANATSNGKPCCVICHGDPKSRQVVTEPDLTGRVAKCSYGDKTTKSSTSLPFFEYLGEGSETAKQKCKCGYRFNAHLPFWEASIKVVRRWFDIENHEELVSRRFHAKREDRIDSAQKEADKFRAMMSEGHRAETRVKSVELLKVESSYVDGLCKCKKFEPIGAQEYDRYYCGCHGWD